MRPSAATAIGSSEVSVIPGLVLHSMTTGVPSAVRIRSVRDTSRHPSTSWTRTAAEPDGGVLLGSQPRRREVLDRAGLEARLVVEDAALARRSPPAAARAAAAVAVVEHRDREFRSRRRTPRRAPSCRTRGPTRSRRLVPRSLDADQAER